MTNEDIRFLPIYAVQSAETMFKRKKWAEIATALASSLDSALEVSKFLD